jgi:hypothetical protein
MWTARTLEAEWRQVLRGSVSTGAEEDDSSKGRVWAAGFHHVTARSRLASVWNLRAVYFFNFPIFFRAALNRGYWISGYRGTTVHSGTCPTKMWTHTVCTQLRLSPTDGTAKWTDRLCSQELLMEEKSHKWSLGFCALLYLQQPDVGPKRKWRCSKAVLNTQWR